MVGTSADLKLGIGRGGSLVDVELVHFETKGQVSLIVRGFFGDKFVIVGW